jgi:hypothetical protein
VKCRLRGKECAFRSDADPPNRIARANFREGQQPLTYFVRSPMSRQYSPKTFLRQVPNNLLKGYFDRRGLLTGVLWYLQRETEVDLIFAAWQALPDADRQAVEKDFQDIDEMACAEGIQALIEEAQFHNVNLASELGELAGYHHKAMWAFLRHERIFYVASLINYVDSLHGRSWVRRADVPRKLPQVSAEACESLANALSAYYQRTQGRGQRCTVETYLRAGRQHYFFAYPDDYTDTYIGHAENGQFIRGAQKRAFELVFVYDPEGGVLELYAKGDRQLKADLQQLFGMTILGEQLAPEAPRSLAYELNGLMDRNFAFPTDPEDGIEEVRVRRLRLSLVGNGSRRITVEADPKGPVQDIYDLMDEFLSRKVLRGAVFYVTQASLEFRFAPRGNVRPKGLKFDVSFPNCSTLKSKREEQRMLGEKYLKRWGIDRA